MRTHLSEIDGWRGLAILAVLFHHLLSAPIRNLDPHIFGFNPSFFYGSGWLGVNVFFILSGFVLFLPYAQGRREMTSWSDGITFYKRRALRLLPAYYLVIVAQMLLSGRQPFDSVTHTWETLTLLTLTFPLTGATWHTPINWALWSIGAEILFSLIFPAICLAVARVSAGRILAFTLITCTTVRAICHFNDGSLITWPSEGLLIGRLDEFLWGIYLADLLCRRSLPNRPWLFAVIGSSLLLLSVYGLDRVSTGTLDPVTYAALIPTFDLGIFLLLAATICPSPVFCCVLNWAPLRVAGMACYSLYLWHMPLFTTLQLHIHPWNLKNLATALAFLCILAGITYRYVEFRSSPDWRPLFGLRPASRKLD